MTLVLSSPLFAYLELTPVCNNRCSGCGNVFERGEAPPLSAGEWRTILGKLAPHILRLRLTGGEPTLHPEFAKIVALVRDLELSFALFTNARWRDPEKVLRLLRDASNFAGMLVSLHGPDAASHEAFTGVVGSFAEAVANIRSATGARLPVSTSTVITKHNHDRIAEIIRLSQNLGAAHAVFSRYLSPDGDGLSPDAEQLRIAMHAVDHARQQGLAVRFSVCIPQCFHPSSSTGCLAGIAYLTVDPFGNVRPCNHAPLIVGNLLEQSLEEVWHSAGMQRWREMTPETCIHCAALPRCHGGCRAAMLMRDLDHDPLMQEPILEAEDPVQLSFPADAYPRFDGLLRPEPFGYVAVRGNRVVPLSHAARSVLLACDGYTTMRQLGVLFGQGALDFLGALYRSGLVELHEFSGMIPKG